MGTYAKGHGANEFYPWLKRTHPKEFVLYCERALGSRQDLCVEGAAAPFIMRVFYLEFLDWKMRLPSFSNILEEFLFTVLTSLEMLAATRVATIIDLFISKPIRWLAGRTALIKTKGDHWSPASMARVVDYLEAALVEIEKDGAKLLDESFLMSIFGDLAEEIGDTLIDPTVAAAGGDFARYLKYVWGGDKCKSPDGTVTLADVRAGAAPQRVPQPSFECSGVHASGEPPSQPAAALVEDRWIMGCIGWGRLCSWGTPNQT